MIENLDEAVKSAAKVSVQAVAAKLNRLAENYERQAGKRKARVKSTDVIYDYRREVERIARILFYINHSSPADGSTEADYLLFRLIDECAGREATS